MKGFSKFFIVLITVVLFVSPITASASTFSTNSVNDKQHEQHKSLASNNYSYDDAEITPNGVPAIIIGIAIRALWRLGMQELARYLSEKGVNAYCSKYGNSGPKVVSNLICK